MDACAQFPALPHYRDLAPLREALYRKKAARESMLRDVALARAAFEKEKVGNLGRHCRAPLDNEAVMLQFREVVWLKVFPITLRPSRPSPSTLSVSGVG